MNSLTLFQDVSRAKLATIIPDPVVAPSIVPVLKDEVDRKPEYPKPDTQQMIPFQPRHLARKLITKFCQYKKGNSLLYSD